MLGRICPLVHDMSCTPITRPIVEQYVRQKTMDTEKSKTKSWGCISIIGVLLVAGLARTMVKSITRHDSETKNSSISYGAESQTNRDKYVDVLSEVAKRMSGTLPMQIDAGTRMDKVTSGPGRVFTYSYTLTTATKDEIDFAEIERSFRPKLIQNYKTMSGMQVFREYDVELRYEYFDRNNHYVTVIKISPKDF